MAKGKNEDPLNKDERTSIKQVGAILNNLAGAIGETYGEGINPIILEETDNKIRADREREKNKTMRQNPPNGFDDFK